MMKKVVIGMALLLASACDKGTPPPSPDTPSSPTAGSTAPPPAPAAMDPAAVEAATGLKPEVTDGVVRVSFPRNEVKVEVDRWTMPPFMGLTSWAGFTPGKAPGVEAMVMGDLVLFEDEVSDAMSAALGSGLQVTALHNHFFFDKPKVYFMHIEGEGSVDTLGKGVKGALDAAKTIRAKSPEPAPGFAGAPLPATNSIDGAKVEAVFGVKGAAKDGMYKVTIGRPATNAACGCQIGKAMGVNTWAAFAGADDNAVVDGDFAVTEDELQPVLKSLRGDGIHVVAIHHHMVGEQPRILFLHYWGRGTAAALATSVKKALNLTKAGG
ncbi:DUF1259 domain-containing protein [Polyangium jinanense]|uniref:DUF1259 domain-containing protein n=1 Tax=Polyangium jinanense TaxID=2829994 RepID=A0A9X3X726_9BACT|nr:DUF1259 domain-containing protein [Polyangium jinanense]MDC3960545.1 DUF1259 domain-containing protein [Polyangium jinanense]MDC3985407.1 DUF1259 domain-containing protein [Polyangium jinanense]